MATPWLTSQWILTLSQRVFNSWKLSYSCLVLGSHVTFGFEKPRRRHWKKTKCWRPSFQLKASINEPMANVTVTSVPLAMQSMMLKLVFFIEKCLQYVCCLILVIKDKSTRQKVGLLSFPSLMKTNGLISIHHTKIQKKERQAMIR